MSSSPIQADLLLFEKPKPSAKTAQLMELAASLSAGLVKETQPPATGSTWSDDGQLTTPHYRRDPNPDLGGLEDYGED